MSLVITKAALALKNADANFDIVKFEAHKRKPKKNLSENGADNQKTSQQIVRKDTDLKKIRHEVFKFGMQGFDAKKKEETKIALAVSLGAKPPRRQYVNYKELMEKRKEEKRKEIEDKQLMNSKNLLQNINKSKSKKKGNKVNDVGHFLTNYGKVQKKDLQKEDKSSKKKKKKKTI